MASLTLFFYDTLKCLNLHCRLNIITVWSRFLWINLRAISTIVSPKVSQNQCERITCFHCYVDLCTTIYDFQQFLRRTLYTKIIIVKTVCALNKGNVFFLQLTIRKNKTNQQKGQKTVLEVNSHKLKNHLKNYKYSTLWQLSEMPNRL